MAARGHMAHSGGMNDSSVIRLIIIDDHPVFREALAHALAAAPDFRVVAQADSGSEAIELWAVHRPDVTLMDISMEGLDGVSAVEGIRRTWPDARVLMLTSSNAADDADAALAKGASGYITKTAGFRDLMAAIREVHAGGRPVASTLTKRLPPRMANPLSPRELEILELLRDGLSQDQIHRRLSITDRMVRLHVAAIKEKLAAESPAHCVARALAFGFLSHTPDSSCGSTSGGSSAIR